MWIALFAALLSVIGTIYSLYLARKKQPFDIRKLANEAIGADASAAREYMEAAQMAAATAERANIKAETLAIKLETTLAELEKARADLMDYKQRVERLEIALEIKNHRIDELEAAGKVKDLKIASLQMEIDELREKVKLLEEKR